MQVEKYKPTENLYVRIIQTSILILSLLLLIRVYWYQKQTDNECWETKFGQEMYRLVLFSFLIIIGSNLLIETVWSFFGSPEFDISRNSINIIYCQVSSHYLRYNQQDVPQTTYLLTVVDGFRLLLLPSLALDDNHHSRDHVLPPILYFSETQLCQLQEDLDQRQDQNSLHDHQFCLHAVSLLYLRLFHQSLQGDVRLWSLRGWPTSNLRDGHHHRGQTGLILALQLPGLGGNYRLEGK